MPSVAVMTDIHSNGYALNMAIADAQSRGIDRFFFLGDYLTDGPDTNALLDTIRSLDAVVIRGNREQYLLDDADGLHPEWNDRLQYAPLRWSSLQLSEGSRAYLRTLPITQVATVGDLNVRLSHGAPEHASRLLLPRRDAAAFEQLAQDYPEDVFLFGHSHVAFEKWIKGKGLFNSGALGLPVNGGGAFHYGILHVHNHRASWQPIALPYDFETVRRYYRNYLDVAGPWGELVMNTLLDGRNHCHQFIMHLQRLAHEAGEDPTRVTSALWQQAVSQWFSNPVNLPQA